MDDINLIKVLSSEQLESWKDSGGSYVEMKSLIEINNEIKKVTFFTGSDYLDRLLIWKGWDPEYIDAFIMFDVDFKTINDKDLLNIYLKLQKEILILDSNKDNQILLENLYLNENEINLLGKRFNKDPKKLTIEDIKQCIHKLIELN